MSQTKVMITFAGSSKFVTWQLKISFATLALRFENLIGKLDVRAVGSERLLFSMRQANEALSKALDHAKQINDATARRLLSFARSEFPGRRVPYPHADPATPGH